MNRILTAFLTTGRYVANDRALDANYGALSGSGHFPSRIERR